MELPANEIGLNLFAVARFLDRLIDARMFRYSPGKRRAAPAKPAKLEDRKARERELNFMVVVLVVSGAMWSE